MKYIFLLFIFVNQISFAQILPTQGPSDEMIERMAIHNQQVNRNTSSLKYFLNSSKEVVPFYEWDETGYLLMSDSDFFGIAREIKKTIAANLPNNVTLIVYTQSKSKSYQQQLKKKYTKYIPEEQLIILEVENSTGDFLPGNHHDFWTRDNTPVPVWVQGEPSFVDARYYYSFEPDTFLKDFFGISLSSHDYFYEGGNLVANSKGDCFVVNRKKAYPGGVSDTASIPDAIFENYYGCKRLTRLKHLKGIGHSDEVVKFMTDEIIITDTEEYIPILEKAGFEVYVFPEPDYKYETYIGSLIVNDVLYVPIFGEENDDKALQLYRDLNLGYKIVPISSRNLSTRGQGSIHCITMNYPPMEIQKITQHLNGRIIN